MAPTEYVTTTARATALSSCHTAAPRWWQRGSERSIRSRALPLFRTWPCPRPSDGCSKAPTCSLTPWRKRPADRRDPRARLRRGRGARRCARVPARLHGDHFRLDVSSPAEAIRALITLRPGLRRVIREGAWRVVVGPPRLRNAIDADMLNMNAGRQPIHVVPATWMWHPRRKSCRSAVGQPSVNAWRRSSSRHRPTACSIPTTPNGIRSLHACCATRWRTLHFFAKTPAQKPCATSFPNSSAWTSLARDSRR